MTNNLLSGLRVVESSAFIAAPLAGMTLSQFGADVIRIDMIGGGIDYGRLPVIPGGRSLYWTALNKGKRSIAIDLRKPEGRELAQALVAAPGEDAGVLLTNIAVPWLSHALLQEMREDVITCIIEGRPDGATAVDYTVNCATGYPAVTGGGSLDRPVNHVLPAWDIACAFQAAFAISAAHSHRRATGAGAQLRIALSDVALSMLSHLGLLTEAELLKQERPSIGNYLYGAFGRDFATADGRRVYVAAISLGQWKSLVKACDVAAAVAELEATRNADFSDEGMRFDARIELAALFEPWFRARPTDVIAEVFDANKVCWGRYGSVGDLLSEDTGIKSNRIFETIETRGVGTHWAAGTPVRFGDGKASPPLRSAPVLGEDTDQILLEVLKLDSGRVGQLHDQRVVAGPQLDPLFSVAA